MASRKPLYVVEGAQGVPPVRDGQRPVRPQRPPDWKPRPEALSPLRLRLPLAPGSAPPQGARLRIATLHRPRKAGGMHLERTLEVLTPQETHVFEDLPAGEYALTVAIPGFRPQVQLLRHGAPSDPHWLAFSGIPAGSAEAERDLLRLGERHPIGEGMRRYLTRFGYLDAGTCRCPADQHCQHVSAALQRFQRAFRLEARGTLTLESFFLGLAPRCLVPDVRPADPAASSAGPTGADSSDPIVFMGDRWDSLSLRYLFQSGTGDISNEWEIVAAALGTWSSSSPLSFVQTGSTSDSQLEYTFRRPGEAGYPFDEGGTKQRNTLAHAWGPPNGTVEFDDHEDWGDTNLAAVATHETGHALGLAHCGVKDSAMYPWYSSGQASLHEVDVRGIKSLYAREVHASGPFVAVPLFGLNQMGGTDSVTIDLGSTRRFLAWGSVTMVDSLADFDRDNMYCIDVYEVDGVRSGTAVYGGDHFGSNRGPANAFSGARAGYGRRITFRLSAGHVADLEVAGYALVLVLT